MQNKNFPFFLCVSCLIHTLFVGILILSNFQSFFSKKKVITSSIKVDLVGLPDKADHKRSLKKAFQEEVPPPRTTKPTQKASLKKTVKKKPSLKPKKSSPKKPQTEKKKPVKGNKVSEGGESGSNEEQETVKIAYLEGIGYQIRANWELPKHLKEDYFYAEVEIRLNEKGELIRKKIITSSQNELVDQLVLEAIEKSAPFPPPPDSIKDFIKNEDVVLGLPSQD